MIEVHCQHCDNKFWIPLKQDSGPVQCTNCHHEIVPAENPAPEGRNTQDSDYGDLIIPTIERRPLGLRVDRAKSSRLSITLTLLIIFSEVAHVIVQGAVLETCQEAAAKVKHEGRYSVSMATRAAAETAEFQDIIVICIALGLLMTGSGIAVSSRPSLSVMVCLLCLLGIGVLSVMLPVIGYSGSGGILYLGWIIGDFLAVLGLWPRLCDALRAEELLSKDHTIDVCISHPGECGRREKYFFTSSKQLVGTLALWKYEGIQDVLLTWGKTPGKLIPIVAKQVHNGGGIAFRIPSCSRTC